jgi:hypothetical protein
MTWRDATVVTSMVCLISISAVLPAQQRDRPVVPEAEAAGTAVIAGRVTLSATSETPVRRAVVTLISSDTVDTYSAVADMDGRFTFSRVPAGRYTLLAKKGAHLTTAFGAKRPGRAGTTLVITEGQQLIGLQLSLPQGGVITGTLRLPNGEPLPNTQVSAIAANDLVGTGRFMTDDRGVYRIYGLQPGEYVVGARPSVGQGEVQQRAAAGYEEAVRGLTAQQLRPAGATAEATPPPVVPTLGYAPTYYPGTVIGANAARVRIEAGDVREGIDFQVDMVRMGRISGVVRGVDGQPTQAVQLSIEPAGFPLLLSAAPFVRMPLPEKDGRFLFSNIAPGAYRVIARAGGVTITPGTVNISGERQTEWAVAEVVVNDSDVEGVTLQLQSGLTFSGSLLAAGQSEGPATWKGTQISVQPPRTGAGRLINGEPAGGVSSRPASVNDDGTFTVAGLQPATYEVVVTLPSALSKTWVLQSIRVGDRDLRDAPLTFDRGSIGDVKVTVTDQRTELAGTLSSASGQAASDYFIVIFPADRTLWHPHSPRVRVARPAADGGFSSRDLPGGDYRVAALTDVEDGEWRISSFLESLYDASIAVSVIDGRTTRQDIRIR